MPKLVVTSATIGCSMAVPPSPTNTFSATGSAAANGESMPAGTIMDNVPGSNIPPFPLCQAKTNPTVIAATAAAAGTPTPAACVPVFPAPWSPGSSSVTIGSIPALHDGCTLNCTYGGTVSIGFPGQTSVEVD